MDQKMMPQLKKKGETQECNPDIKVTDVYQQMLYPCYTNQEVGLHTREHFLNVYQEQRFAGGKKVKKNN